MAYAFVSSTNSGTHTLPGLVVSAGQSLIISAFDGDGVSSSSTLTITDGTNTYTTRGSKGDTRNVTTSALIDCLAPTPGTYTLTLNGSDANLGYFIVSKYTGLQSYSAGSFASFFSGATPPTTTDGCTTTAITPTGYPAMIFCTGTVTGTLTAGTGFTVRYSNQFGGPGFWSEDLRLATSGSNIASYTMSAGGTDVVIMGAAYLEAASAVVIPLLGQILM
jgi:hypothetical protein